MFGRAASVGRYVNLIQQGGDTPSHFTGGMSRRRDCHFDDTPCSSLFKPLLKVQGDASRVTVSPTAAGGIFTFDSHDSANQRSYDFRTWGGAYWWQNTRFAYSPMLQDGDFEQLLPLFELYAGMLPGARPPQHGLSSQNMALITSDYCIMRYVSTKWS